ncbi:MAG: HAMP domain-containing histidine kinase [Defluviitaleaceae bacterium]|nr:HAMP domain-containing histidine kinase [Defluviitaleaceae bacterium]
MTRGGVFGERFADMPQIPVVSAYEAEEAFGRGDFAYITSDVSMFRSDLGDYIIIVADNYRQSVYGFHNPPMRMYISIAMVYLLIVIVLANILLAKYITRRITSPIDILARGVDEISVGNLTHRIEYSKGDEFDAVCASFNEMAERLHSMVQQRQADEKNRRELIAGISHDLRTPLTSVKAYIEGLRKGVATTPEKQEKYLSTIQSKTEDIEYIITQLFTFSKIDTGEFPFNLEVVDIACELAKVMDVAEGVEASHVLVDVVQFRNVLENIHSNSVKYSGREDVKVLASCEKQGDDMVITIADNGVGVPDEMLTKIFDVFVRGDESRNNPAEGSGLGLAISAKIIERLGGTIRAENVAEGGLAVIITLPIHKGV